MPPDRHASSLGILDGRPAFVPGVAASFDVPTDPAFIDRILAEVVRRHRAPRHAPTTEQGDLRYIAVPVAIDDDRGVFVLAVDVGAELDDFAAATGAYVAGGRGRHPDHRPDRLAGGRPPARADPPAAARRRGHHGDRPRARVSRSSGHDDVSALTATVNDMLDRLDAALTSQRRLLDDVRHELKTPITIVRGHVELMNSGDPRDVETTRLIAIDELDRMSGLIDEIEVLAESRMLVTRRATRARRRARRRGVRQVARHPRTRLALGRSPRTSMVSVDRAKIVQAWLQLVDNAVKYSPAGSPIVIGCVDFEGAVEFWVQDSGPGIPPGAELRIFERHAREHDGERAGSGLGLSIVRSIVAAHARPGRRGVDVDPAPASDSCSRPSPCPPQVAVSA